MGQAIDLQTRQLALVGEILAALTRGDSLRELLQPCAQTLVDQLDAAFARIWTVNEAEHTLELQASAGLYTHLDGPHGRVPIGQLKIGLIAQERRPHLTNQVVGDPRVSEQDWARREGMIAFAGYPLTVEGSLSGVLAVFARHSLENDALEILASVADLVALGIERKRVQDALLASNRRLLDLDRQKDEFLSSVAHDLKTPLTGMKGLAQLLRRRATSGREIDRTKLVEGLERIDQAASRMSSLIEELTDMTRLQMGQGLDLQCDRTDLVALLTRVVHDQAEATLLHRLIVRDDDSDLKGWWDEKRLDRVFSNLLANAIKYSPEGGEILVNLSRFTESGRVWAAARIEDRGIGIPAAELPHIFERFYRAANVPARITGTGIGLAGAKQIIELHGGKITAQSAEGVGSAFTVSLPMGEPA